MHGMGISLWGLLFTTTRGSFPPEGFVTGEVRVFRRVFRRGHPASVFFYFAGLPGLRAEVRAFLFNYVRFKFHSRVFMKFTYCIYMFIDSVSGLSLVLSLLFDCTDMRYRISVIMLVIRFLLLSLYTPLIHIIVYSVNGAKLFWL